MSLPKTRRNNQIRKYYNKKVPLRVIAAKYGLHFSTIQGILGLKKNLSTSKVAPVVGGGILGKSTNKP